MVLVRLPVPGRPTNLEKGGARAYCACCGWGCLDFFSFVCRFSLSLSLSLFGSRFDIE